MQDIYSETQGFKYCYKFWHDSMRRTSNRFEFWHHRAFNVTVDKSTPLINNRLLYFQLKLQK